MHKRTGIRTYQRIKKVRRRENYAVVLQRASTQRLKVD